MISGLDMTFKIGHGRIPTNLSIDKVDPSKGYTVDNIQLVCSAVNAMKSDLDYDTFYMFVENIYKNARNARGWNK